MAQEYKIKFEYKSSGKKSAGSSPSKSGGGFPKAPQSAKDSFPGISKISQARGGSGKETLTLDKSIKNLNSNVPKLIRALQENTNAEKKAGQEQKKAEQEQKKGGNGLKMAGAAVAGLGVIGFAIGQIQKVADAYIDLTSQQIGNVGIGGFRSGRGVYTSAQMGAGIKAYGTATGKFIGSEESPAEQKAALRMGAIYGLSAEETFQTAGQITRATGKKNIYGEAAQIGAGGGIQSELSIMMQGMADILTESVREGVNTSDMANDMAKNIASIVEATPTKSVEAAMNIVKSFQGVKGQVAAGKMASTEGLETLRASQELLMQKLQSDPKFLERLQSEGFVSSAQAQAISGLKQGASFEDLQKVSKGAAFPLLRKFTAEVDSTELKMQSMRNAQKRWGATPEGLQQYLNFTSSTGFAETDAQTAALWKAASMSPDQKAMAQKGEGILSKQEDVVSGSDAAIGVERAQMREGMVLEYGSSFANTSLQMEKLMNNLVEVVAPTIEMSLPYLEKGINLAAKGLGGLQGALSETTKAVEEFGEKVKERVQKIPLIGGYFK